MQKNVFQAFEKCANYSVIASVVTGTLMSMGRFKKIPHDKVITKVYQLMKERAAA